MSFFRFSGWLAIAVAFVTLAYGVALLLPTATLPTSLREPTTIGASMVVAAVVMFVAAVGASRGPVGEPARGVQIRAAPRETDEPPAYEIKRTDMNWAPPADQPDAERESGDELAEVKRQLAKLKVDYGLGRLNAKSYQTLRAELEAQEAELERVRRGATR